MRNNDDNDLAELATEEKNVSDGTPEINHIIKNLRTYINHLPVKYYDDNGATEDRMGNIPKLHHAISEMSDTLEVLLKDTPPFNMASPRVKEEIGQTAIQFMYGNLLLQPDSEGSPVPRIHSERVLGIIYNVAAEHFITPDNPDFCALKDIFPYYNAIYAPIIVHNDTELPRDFELGRRASALMDANHAASNTPGTIQTITDANLLTAVKQFFKHLQTNHDQPPFKDLSVSQLSCTMFHALREAATTPDITAEQFKQDFADDGEELADLLQHARQLPRNEVVTNTVVGLDAYAKIGGTPTMN